MDGTARNLIEVANRVRKQDIGPIQLFGSEISGIHPDLVQVLYRSRGSKSMTIRNGFVIDPLTSYSTREAAIFVYFGKSENLGIGIAQFDSLPAEPEGIKNELLTSHTVASMINAAASHASSAVDNLGVPDLFKKGSALSVEQNNNYFDTNVQEWPSFSDLIQFGREITKILSEHPNIENATLSFSGIRGLQYCINSDGLIVAEPRQSGQSYLALEGYNNQQELVAAGFPFHVNYMEELLNLPNLINDPNFLQRVIGVPDLSILADAFSTATNLKSGKFNCVFSPSTVGTYFHEGIVAHLVCLDDVLEQNSQLFGFERIGEQVLPKHLTVIDDPTIPYGPLGLGFGSYCRDDEGIPGKPLTIINKGILTGEYLSNRIAAGTAKLRKPEYPHLAQSNGHGRLGHIVPPEYYSPYPDPRLSNIIIRSSEHGYDTVADMVNAAEPNSLYLVGGGGQVNPESGNFELFPSVIWFMEEQGYRLIHGCVPTMNATNLDYIDAVTKETDTSRSFCGSGSGWVRTSDTAPGISMSNVPIVSKPPIVVYENVFKDLAN